MKKHFYSHLISIDSLHVSLNEMNLSEKEKEHLHSLIEENIHYEILDLILSELSHEDKKQFLKYIHEDNHDTTWQFLKDKIEQVDQKITKASQLVIDSLHSDIQEVASSK